MRINTERVVVERRRLVSQKLQEVVEWRDIQYTIQTSKRLAENGS